MSKIRQWARAMLFCGLPLSLPTYACDQQDLSNPGILECLNESYSAMDAVLNEQYRAVLQAPAIDATAVRAVQRAWLKYRDTYCDGVFENEGMNGEAKLMRVSCLSALTGARAGELIYYRTGVAQDGFARARRLVDEAPAIFSKRFATQDLSESESAYYQSNCRLVGQLHHEPKAYCLERMQFQSIF